MSLLHGGVDRNPTTPAVHLSSTCRSFTGAWIETPVSTTSSEQPSASLLHGGVDRNTSRSSSWPAPPPVAPSRGRGSKQLGKVVRDLQRWSLLHGGVDRNSRSKIHASSARWSLLHGGVDRNSERILKPQMIKRRSFTGAWIETRRSRCRRQAKGVAPSRGRGSKPAQRPVGRSVAASLLHGAVDRNRYPGRPKRPAWSRSFTGAWIETANGSS